MVMKKLRKLYNKMLNHSTSKNMIYEKYIRWQFIDFMDKLDVGKLDFLRNILPLFLFLLKWLSIFIFMITIGYSINQITVNKLENKIIEKQNDIEYLKLREKRYIYIIENYQTELDSVASYKKSIDWIKYKIHNEANLENYKVINRVDEDILVFMWNEHKKYDIPTTIYFRLIELESAFMWVDNKTSGAMGYMQVMPATYNLFNKQLDIGKHNKINNIRVGTFMLYEHYNRWKEMGLTDKTAWKYTLAEYNAGINKMKSEMGYYLPSYTYSYFNYILKYYEEV